jgi:hypothetical protein
MYDKATRVPPPGDPMEIFFLLIWKMRQDIEFQKSRATLQALLNQKGAEAKHIEEAFEELKNAFFPYDRNQRKQEIGNLRQAMMREIARGALSVTPMVDPDHRKVANRLARGQERLMRRQQQMIDLSGAREVHLPRGPRRNRSAF